MQRLFTLFFTISLITFQGLSQKTISFDYWKLESESNISIPENKVRYITPKAYQTFSLDIAKAKTFLASAPVRFSSLDASLVKFNIPMPDGSFRTYLVEDAEIMPKVLSDQFPEIKTYTGYNIDDHSETVKFDLTPQGFHALIFTNDQGIVMVDPIFHGDAFYHQSYKALDHENPNPHFQCGVEDHDEMSIPENNVVSSALPVGDCGTLKRYRTAITATGEYTVFHGGTVNGALAAINTALNRLNGFFEREMRVTLQLIPNNNLIVFTNPNTDPYDNTSNSSMINTNQSEVDSRIGSANYDIGHVFGQGGQGGGLAQLNAPCGNGKARAVSAVNSPQGDRFLIDIVAHEMGHQFGASHSFNNDCGGNISPNTAFETGSGSTIMSYAGVCSPNVINDADPYYHGGSLKQIFDFTTTGNGNTCPTKINVNNQAPVLTNQTAYTIPKNTSFELIAVASNAQNDTLTYCWEQIDNASGVAPPTPTSPGPVFRSWLPTNTPVRTFPRINDLVNNTINQWEAIPNPSTGSRLLNFRCTVRDNARVGGCIDQDDLTVTVSSASGPFLMTAPNTSGISWQVGSSQTVTWNVAGTTGAPVNCSAVDIFLSTDGGFTYPVTIVSGVPNNGTATITVPNNVSNNCRIKVKGSNNIFFDISNVNFAIIEPLVPTFLLTGSTTVVEGCPGTTQSSTGRIEYVRGFTGPITLSGTGPAGISFIFPNPVNAQGPFNFSVVLSSSVPTGVYNFSITGTSGTIVRTANYSLRVRNNNPAQVTLLSPANLERNVYLQPRLSWSRSTDASQYVLELSSTPDFTGATSLTLDSTFFDFPSRLTENSVLFWRVRPINGCGSGPVSPSSQFQLIEQTCFLYSDGQNRNIGVFPMLTVPLNLGLTFPISDDFIVSDLAIGFQLAHTNIGDIGVTFRTPGLIVDTLMNRPGFPTTTTGCTQDNINVIFDDGGALSPLTLENTCNTSNTGPNVAGPPFAISGTYRPIQRIGNARGFRANNPNGWTLNFIDFVPQTNGGFIDSLYFILCTADPLAPQPLFSKNTLTAAGSSTTTIPTANMNATATGSTADNIGYVIYRLPSKGVLKLRDTIQGIGDVILQSEINANQFSYQHTSAQAGLDTFRFSVRTSDGGWIVEDFLPINIIANTLAVGNIQPTSPLCNNGTNGSITVTASGGNPPFSYRLNNGSFQTANNFPNLASGTYTVTIRDNFNFTATSSQIVLANPSAISASASVVGRTITVTAAGGTGTLSYSIDGINFQPSNVFNNVVNGSYTVTIRDQNNCISTTTAIVAVGALVPGANLTTAVSCNNGNDGVITASAAGGVGPYTYSRDGVTFVTNPVFNGLAPGNYTITVKDNTGSTATATNITIPNPPAINSSASVNVNVITVTASGGTGTLNYSLDGITYQASNVFNNVANGAYTVRVRDARGCIGTTPATVNVAVLNVSLSNQTNISCNAGTNGSITVAGSGGVPGYQYSINGGGFQSSNVFNNLPAGTYTITVRDNSGNTRNSNLITLTQPDGLVVNANVFRNTVTFQATGGVPPYAFSPTFTPPLTNGNYTVTVTDGNNCTKSHSFTINYAPVSGSISVTTPINCFGENNGQIAVTSGGGTPPYSYSLNNGAFQTSSIFNNIAAGSASVQIRDFTGEIFTVNLNVTQPALLVINNVTQPSLGSAVVNVVGGVTPYAYNINGGTFQTSNTFSSLANGSYIARVRDNNGCVSQPFTFVVSGVASLEPIADFNLEIFPNPNSGEFTLKFNHSENGEISIRVLDMIGRECYRTVFNKNSSEASIPIQANLPAGNYAIMVNSGKWWGRQLMTVTK
jgi:hypothetical protein